MMRLALATISSTCAFFQSHFSNSRWLRHVQAGVETLDVWIADHVDPKSIGEGAWGGRARWLIDEELIRR